MSGESESLKAVSHWFPYIGQEEPGGARRSQEEPGGARRGQVEPGGARAKQVQFCISKMCPPWLQGLQGPWGSQGAPGVAKGLPGSPSSAM